MKKLILSILALCAFTCAGAAIHNRPTVIDYANNVVYIEYQSYEYLCFEGGKFYPCEYREVTSRDAEDRVLTLNKYNYDSDSLKYTFTYKGVYSYNAAGQMLQEDQQYAKREYLREMTYDSNGNIVRYLSSTKKSQGKLENSYREDYGYDDQGQMVTVDDYNYYYSGSVAYRNYHQMLHYNDAGQLSFVETCKTTDDDGNWTSCWTYNATYDENGELAKCVVDTRNNDSGELEHSYTITYTYNDHGDMLSERIDYADGSDSRTTTYSYTYDEQGRMTSYTETTPDGGKYQHKYTYDDSAASIENVTVSTPRSCKTIENGQVVIIREGVRYNALGQRM